MDFAIAVLKAFVPIFVIVSPVGAVPLFLGMTQADSTAQRQRTALIAALTTTCTLLGAALVGQQLFDFFGVTIDAFRIAGGFLLFLIALDFVQVRQTRMKATEPEIAEGVEKQETGIIPLGIPMLAGPGAIATVMVLSHGGWPSLGPVLVAIVLVGLSTLLVLLAAARMQQHLSATTLGIVLRLEGLLLAAIAVQMVVTGVTNLVLSSLPRS
ncbi:MAG: MarC family protein [Planctomycetota bacterium]|nr:MarC family protein [Planctomycetota bacterium]MCX8039356.1 MarC family protein [Planctomycetota bacterium]MDW8373647.1 MarC family protein [Planctomycetota bacterium]